MTVSLTLDREAFVKTSADAIRITGSFREGPAGGPGGGFGGFGGPNRSVIGELRLTKSGTKPGDEIVGSVDFRIVETHGGLFQPQRPAGPPPQFGAPQFGAPQSTILLRTLDTNGDFTNDGMQTIGDSPVFVRGEPDQPGDSRVPRGTLQILTTEPLKASAKSSGRLEFAEWVASRENPLTARVMVNRVWLQLFGRGLVPTADDFGLASRPPTHTELLDHLAIQFIDDGWSVKKLIKYLVMSRVYQLSSTASPAAMEVDPDNTLLWRMAPRRLDAECLRDAMLAVSGQLDTTPPVGSVVALSGEGPVTSFGRNSTLAAVNDPRNTHRSIYLPIIRDNLPEALALFDGADPSLITADRQQTTVPSQALFLLNNEFVARASDAAAGRRRHQRRPRPRSHR